jgi:hypothetical protein
MGLLVLLIHAGAVGVLLQSTARPVPVFVPALPPVVVVPVPVFVPVLPPVVVVPVPVFVPALPPVVVPPAPVFVPVLPPFILTEILVANRRGGVAAATVIRRSGFARHAVHSPARPTDVRKPSALS